MESMLQVSLLAFNRQHLWGLLGSCIAIGVYSIILKRCHTPGSGRYGITLDNKLLPESLYAIEFAGPYLRHTFPNGEYEEICWDDLQSIEIETTDQGPWLPDVFWIVTDSQSRCVIAQGAQGEDELLERLQQLPGFDNEQLILAMGSVTNQCFRCWQSTRQIES